VAVQVSTDVCQLDQLGQLATASAVQLATVLAQLLARCRRGEQLIYSCSVAHMWVTAVASRYPYSETCRPLRTAASVARRCAVPTRGSAVASSELGRAWRFSDPRRCRSGCVPWLLACPRRTRARSPAGRPGSWRASVGLEWWRSGRCPSRCRPCAATIRHLYVRARTPRSIRLARDVSPSRARAAATDAARPLGGFGGPFDRAPEPPVRTSPSPFTRAAAARAPLAQLLGRVDAELREHQSRALRSRAGEPCDRDQAWRELRTHPLRRGGRGGSKQVISSAGAFAPIP